MTHFLDSIFSLCIFLALVTAPAGLACGALEIARAFLDRRQARRDRAALEARQAAARRFNDSWMTPARAARLASMGYQVEIDADKGRAIVRHATNSLIGARVYRLA